MINPIPKAIRATIYIAGVCVGVFGAVTGPLSTWLGWSQGATAFAVSAVGAATTLCTTLAAANLTAPNKSPTEASPEGLLLPS